MLVTVLTTIQRPTPSVLRLSGRLAPIGAELIAVGDKKGPDEFSVPGAHFLSLSAQLASGFRLAHKLPVGHYARKNIGYLVGIQRGAECIYETDDDNAPNGAWKTRTRSTLARICSPRRWANVYRMFSEEHIWPRGFPLDLITDRACYSVTNEAVVDWVDAPIQQGLANGSPDVDAVWRLTLDRDFQFNDLPSVFLPAGTWCPFNSQSTWWWRPSFRSFVSAELLLVPND